MEKIEREINSISQEGTSFQTISLGPRPTGTNWNKDVRFPGIACCLMPANHIQRLCVTHAISVTLHMTMARLCRPVCFALVGCCCCACRLIIAAFVQEINESPFPIFPSLTPLDAVIRSGRLGATEDMMQKADVVAAGIQAFCEAELGEEACAGGIPDVKQARAYRVRI